MMKPDHAITKCEPPPPRPFPRAFHSIILVAAEVTRLKLHLAAQSDDLPEFVNLQPACNEQLPVTFCPLRALRLGGKTSPSPTQSNRVQVSQTQSNYARPTFGLSQPRCPA